MSKVIVEWSFPRGKVALVDKKTFSESYGFEERGPQGELQECRATRLRLVVAAAFQAWCQSVHQRHLGELVCVGLTLF